MKRVRAENEKSVNEPGKLRLLVLPSATSDTCRRSCSTASTGTPSAARARPTASGNVIRRRLASRIGIRTGSRERSLINSAAWRLPIRSRFPCQSPRRVVDRTRGSSPSCFSRNRSCCVHRRTTIRSDSVPHWQNRGDTAFENHLQMHQQVSSEPPHNPLRTDTK
jgi:hypothetical protein